MESKTFSVVSPPTHTRSTYCKEFPPSHENLLTQVMPEEMSRFYRVALK
jgi:hypothetical protein